MSKSKPTVELEGPIRRTNRFFIAIKSYGHCDDSGKVAMGVECSTKKIPAPPDRPLRLVRMIMEDIVIPTAGYSSRDAMEADLQAFKEYVNGLAITEAAS